MSDAPLEELEKLWAEHPTDVRARLRLADAYRAQGRPDDALTHYLEAARQFGREGTPLKAIVLFKMCIALGAPVHAEAIEQGRLLGLSADQLDLDKPLGF